MSTEPQTVTQRYPGFAFVVVLALVLALVAFSFFTREPSHARPILTGTAESGTFWKSPMSNASNEGFSVKGQRIDVYETFVVATNPETGAKHVRPHGFYSDLAVK